MAEPAVIALFTGLGVAFLAVVGWFVRTQGIQLPTVAIVAGIFAAIYGVLYTATVVITDYALWVTFIFAFILFLIMSYAAWLIRTGR